MQERFEAAEERVDQLARELEVSFLDYDELYDV